MTFKEILLGCLLAATMTVTACDSNRASSRKWDPIFKETQQNNFTKIALASGFDAKVAIEFGECFADRVEEGYSQQEYLLLDSSPAGADVGREIARGCFCKISQTRDRMRATLGCP